MATALSTVWTGGVALWTGTATRSCLPMVQIFHDPNKHVIAHRVHTVMAITTIAVWSPDIRGSLLWMEFFAALGTRSTCSKKKSGPLFLCLVMNTQSMPTGRTKTVTWLCHLPQHRRAPRCARPAPAVLSRSLRLGDCVLEHTRSGVSIHCATAGEAGAEAPRRFRYR